MGYAVHPFDRRTMLSGLVCGLWRLLDARGLQGNVSPFLPSDLVGGCSGVFWHLWTCMDHGTGRSSVQHGASIRCCYSSAEAWLSSSAYRGVESLRRELCRLDAASNPYVLRMGTGLGN